MKCYPSLPFLSIPPDSIQLLVIILAYNSLKKNQQNTKITGKKYKNEWKQEKKLKKEKKKNKQASSSTFFFIFLPV